MGLTKKCPYCAENIKYKAVICKHCGKDLPAKKGFIESVNEERRNRIKNMTKKENQAYTAEKEHNNKIVILWFVILLGALLASSKVGYWALLMPTIGVWLHPRQNESLFKNRFKHFKKEKVRSVLSAILLLAMLVGLSSQLVNYVQSQMKQAKRMEEQKIIDEYPEPKITILSSQDHQGDNLTYLVQLEVQDAETVEVNYNIVEGKDDNYSTEVPLEKIETTINIVAKNEHKRKTESFDIKRNETPEKEQIRLEKEAKRAEAKAEKEATLARIEAELAAQKAEWEASRAGQICNEYPYWDKNDCEKVANNKIWIGMSYDMLVEERGLPTSTNPSDYGYGTEWQWCWTYYTPMCFYDDDDDGIIDSFN